MSNVIAPVQNTNNIRYADFVRVTTPTATYRFASTPSALTIPAVDSEPFGALGTLMKVGDAQQDIKSTANETTFTMVGIDTAMLGWVLGQEIKGSQIEAWHGFFDTNGILLSNYLKYSQTFTNAIWDKYQCSVTANAAIAPDGTNTASKLTLSGVTDPMCGQRYETNASLVGQTVTFSIWAWTDAGQTTNNCQLFIYNDSVAQVGYLGFNLTTTPTKYVVTYTFPVGTTGTGITVRFDPPENNSAGNYVYCWGAQLQYGSQASEYLPTTATNNSGLYQFFNGYINSFNITETWMEEVRTFVGVITVAASSIQLILRNRVAGRYTNNSSWQFFNSGDTSMSRVAFVSTINYLFGKDAPPES
jgi:hypothetical protein